MNIEQTKMHRIEELCLPELRIKHITAINLNNEARNEMIIIDYGSESLDLVHSIVQQLNPKRSRNGKN